MIMKNIDLIVKLQRLKECSLLQTVNKIGRIKGSYYELLAISEEQVNTPLLFQTYIKERIKKLEEERDNLLNEEVNEQIAESINKLCELLGV